MPVQSGEPIGPFPAGVDPVEYDKLRRRVLWAMPSGLYLIGSRSGVERNLMTANWATQLSFEPKLVGISVVRKFVKPARLDPAAMTLNDVVFRDGSVTGVPVLSQAVAWLECRLRDDVPCGHHTLFVGEVVDCGFEKAEETPVLRMEDTRMNYGG